MDKNIKIKEIIADVKAGNNFADKVKIRRYIPILEKGDIARNYLFKVNSMNLDLMDPVTKVIESEMLWRFNVLLEFTNIKVDDDDITFENYDVLSSSGVFDHIKEECGLDFTKMEKFIMETMMFSRNDFMSDMLKSANGDNLKESLKEFKEILGDKELVNKMSEIIAFNDPIAKAEIEKAKAVVAKEKLKADIETKK
jgi:hypothetical protein|nr:MAG TPA: hypothetical protein [Caudoviricetes sp.]